MDAEGFWQQVSDPLRPPLLLPDVGTFFNQDLDGGAALIAQVCATAVPCVKGELLHDPAICLPGPMRESYLTGDGRVVQEDYRALIERKVLPLDAYRVLFQPVLDSGRGLCLSVYDFAGADFAAELGACALKIASTNLVHAPLIRHVAGLRLPMIIDTGKASLAEAMRAVDWADRAGARRIVLEYSPPAPPAPVQQQNLRVISRLRDFHSGPIGLSDHHAGPEMLYAAAALGYRILEKGVCADAQQSDQDVYHALPVGQLPQVLQLCETIHAGLGSADSAYPPPASRPAARMGLVAASDLAAGTRIDLETVRFAFPAQGIPVEQWDRVSGQRLKRAVRAGQPLTWDDADAATP